MKTSEKFNEIKPSHSMALSIFMGLIIFIIIPVAIGFFYSYKIYENIIIEEMSKNNIKNITQFKNDFNTTFDNIAKISNLIINNSYMQSVLENENADYYQRNKIITKVFNDVMLYNDLPSENVKITFFDNKGQVYSNWSLNFNNYGFILDKDWVKQALKSNYYALWSNFEASFDKEEKNVNYVSLARSIESSNNYNIGTLIISLSEKEFSRIFKKYMPEKNSSLLISSSKEEILTYVGDGDISKFKRISKLIKEDNTQNLDYRLININNEKYLVNSYKIKNSEWTAINKEWKITIISSYEKIASQLKVFSSKITAFFTVAAIFLFLATIYVTVKIFYPIKKLEKVMYDFDLNSNFNFVNLKRKDEIGYLNKAFYKMATSIKELFEKLESEHKIKEIYRYESLRAQLNPHFLFNTLNTIRWMALIRKADNIVETVDALGNILKYSMKRGGEMIPLKDEMENIRSYVFIQNNRYGSSYQVKYEIEDSLMELKIIKFILQPIVENSIIHAFEDRDGVGCITIKGKIEDSNLILSVVDNGIGMTESEIKKIFQEKDEKISNDSKVTGLGIKTIHDMLKIACGQEYGLEVQSLFNNGTQVRLVLPVIYGEENANV